MANLTPIVSFSGADGGFPSAGLIADSQGDLFGTTADGGAYGHGTVFEITKTAHGYADAPTTLASFNGTDGSGPSTELIADASGDLFGTTQFGGAANIGTVFEITKTASGYADAPTTLVNFNGYDGRYPNGVIADASGDLFGTTELSGAYGYGTVFEITKTASGYAGAPTTLASFDGPDGSYPYAGLIADAGGDLFGTTQSGGAGGNGKVFEIIKTASGYADPTPLVTFDFDGGSSPLAGLIADASGDLFGTISGGGADGDGAVFEITKTASGYADAPTILDSFNGGDGNYIASTLVADASGDLFGITPGGGAVGYGTIFEVVKTADGYASVPTTLVSFDTASGEYPNATLIADASGDLFGTTEDGGADGDGTVFELTNTGFVVGSTPSLGITGHQQALTLGSSETSVTVAGYDNSVTGTGTAAVTVALTGLGNTLDLGDGNDTVTTSGKGFGSTITLGNGTDTVTLGTNNDTATLGNGNDTIALGGFNNTVTAGNGNDSVTGGTGHGTVTLGNGTNTVTLGGWDNSIALGLGTNTVDAGAGASTVSVTGGQLALAVHGHADMVFLHGDTAGSITDTSKDLSLTIDSAAVVASITGFGAATGGVVHLLDLGFTSVQQVLGALHGDGHGGTTLALGSTGSVDFTTLAPQALHAANFALS